KLNPDDLLIKEWNRPALKALFADLEFRRLAEQIGLDGPAPSKNGNEKAPASKPAEKKKELPGTQGSLFFTNAPATKIAYSFEETIVVEVLPEPGNYKSISEVEHTYHVVDTPEKRKKLIEDLQKQKTFCFDTETTGLDVNRAELVGMSFAFKPFEAYYVPVPSNYDAAHQVVSEFAAVFANEKIDKTGQNIKYDISVLKWYDIEIGRA